MMTHHRKRCGLHVLLSGSLALLALSATTTLAAQPTLDELVQAAQSSDEATQLEAVHGLGLHGVAAVPTLNKLLKSDSPTTRAYAARALGEIGHPALGATEGLLELLSDQDVIVRRQALEALKHIRPGPKVSVPLFAKLMHDSDPGIRMRVMEAVAEAKGNAVPALIEALKNPDAAYWACIILRDIGPDAAPAVPALAEALKDSRPEVRREAVLALAAIGSPQAADSIVPLLSDEHARTAATFALGALKQMPAEAESVVRANAGSKDQLLSTTSLWALAITHPDDAEMGRAAATQLVERLKNNDPYVRTAAARALASLPPNPKVMGPIFEKALAGADEQTTHYLLDAVASQGAPAVPKLVNALEHKALRKPIASILGRIGPDASPATPALAKLLADEDPNVSKEAALALASIGPGASAAVPQLVEMLKHPEGKPVYAAAFALGSIGPEAKAAEPALLHQVQASDDSLSLLSAWALVQIKGPAAAKEVLPKLAAGLKSSLPRSRRMAAETLGTLGPAAKPLAAPLEQATKDGDPAVRDAATKALESVRG